MNLTCHSLSGRLSVLKQALNDVFDVDEFNFYLVCQKCDC